MQPIQEERFEYKGFPCVVLFMPMGFRNGYVGLPKTNKHYEEHYECIPVNCHCGLTYSDSKLFGQDDKETWWIGFDCSHACDGFDVATLKQLYGNDNEVMEQVNAMEHYYNMMNEECPIRTLEYVKENCMGIVDQLLKESEE